MAACITPQWVSGAPQVGLSVNITDSSPTTYVKCNYILEYIASSDANTSYVKPYTITIDGKVVKSGSYDIDGKTGTHQICGGTFQVDKGTSIRAMSFSVSFDFNLTWSGVYKAKVSASGTINIPANTHVSIQFNANGGTGAPAKKTSKSGATVTLPTTKPTRTGFTFKNWNTKSDGTGTSYAAGGTLKLGTSNVTLYAIWTRNTYTVTYNANGGTGAPGKQTKSYGIALTLSTTIPTRNKYTFKGWARSATGLVAFAPGASYTANSAITLYAVWERTYVKPSLYSVTAPRSEDGTSIFVHYSVISVYKHTEGTVYAKWVDSDGLTHSTDPESSTWSSDTNGDLYTTSCGMTITGVDPEYACTVYISVKDRESLSASYVGTTTITVTSPGLIFPIDILSGGKGVSFGKAATLQDTVDFGWDAKFNKPVYGKALGMDKVTQIPKNSDLNDYIDPGCYAIYGDTDAASCLNVPTNRAGRLEVWSATGEGIRSAQWSYIKQRYIPYCDGFGDWERSIQRSSDNQWTYGDWHLCSDYNELLWEGHYFMNKNQVVILPRRISQTQHGIVLVFCGYDDADSTDFAFEYFFVPKKMVTLTGNGSAFLLGRNKFTYVGSKYLYFRDEPRSDDDQTIVGKIKGHEDNELSGTSACGINYNNNKFVLRYVIGV